MSDLAKQIAPLSPEKRALLLQKMQEKMVAQQLQQKQAGNAQQQILPQKRNSDICALSFAQERLWFLYQLDPQSAAYHMPSTLRLHGTLSIASLEYSLAAVILRHESLRTVFQEHEGEPVQVIKPSLSLQLPVIDLRGGPARQQEELVRELSRQEALHLFDFATGPLLRTRVLRLDEQEHVLLFNMHHIISDGWSMGLLIQEFSQLYQAEIKGEPANLPVLPIQYADYALWQREWLQGEMLDKQLAYWRQQLAGAPAALNLPTNRPRPTVQAYAGAMQTFLLPFTLLQELKELSQREGATLFMTLLAAFKVLLMRYSGETDIVVGSPIANRRQDELKSLIGFFVNLLVLRTDLRGNPCFLQLLARVRKVALQAYEHQDLPFEKLVGSELASDQRSLSHSPLFQVLFALQNVPRSELSLAGVSWSQQEREHFTTMFDLSLMLVEVEKGLLIEVEYSTALFDDATIPRMLSHWQVLLEAIVHDPGQSIETLPLLTPREHELVAYGFAPLVKQGAAPATMPTMQGNTTTSGLQPVCPSDIYPNICLHQLIEQQVEQTPDTIAVAFGEEQQLTYRELNSQANQLASRLQERGIGPDVLVGICMERSLELVVALLAVLKAGGAYVPLDPSYPQERFSFLLEDTQVSVVLIQAHLRDFMEQARKLLPNVEFICLESSSFTSHLDYTDNPVSLVQPENLAYLLYTSGSTGRPKGVMIQHRSSSTMVQWARHFFSKHDLAGVLASTSLSFDLAVFEVFVPLSTGGTVVLVENLLHLPAMRAASRVTLVNTVPSVLSEMLRLSPLPVSVRTVNLAGEPPSPSLIEQLYQQETIQQVFNLYGPSEDTTYSTVALVERSGTGKSPARDPVPIGRPIAKTQIYLLDKNLSPVPIGVTGELFICGEGLARGYYRQPDLTAERFIPNPFAGTGQEQSTVPTTSVRAYHYPEVKKS